MAILILTHLSCSSGSSLALSGNWVYTPIGDFMACGLHPLDHHPLVLGVPIFRPRLEGIFLVNQRTGFQEKPCSKTQTVLVYQKFTMNNYCNHYKNHEYDQHLFTLQWPEGHLGAFLTSINHPHGSCGFLGPPAGTKLEASSGQAPASHVFQFSESPKR